MAWAFEPLPLGAPQHEIVGSGSAVEILVNPVFIGRYGDVVSRAEIDQYFQNVGRYLEVTLAEKTGKPVVIKPVDHTDRQWTHHFTKRFKTREASARLGGDTYRTFEFSITNAILRFRIRVDDLNHSDIVDVTQDVHRKMEAGSFGVLFRTPYAQQVYRDNHFDNYLKNDLRLSIEGYVETY